MGKRNYFSFSQIDHMIAVSKHNRREREKTELIRAQGGNYKELKPTYELTKVEFSAETRLSKIFFKEEQYYRTIDRYVTQNYVRYPIYSNWKLRTKEIKKSLKLTNEVLEKLNSNEDYLIRFFANEIIAELHNTELYPSWFIKNFLVEDYNNKIQSLEDEKTKFRKCKQYEINQNRIKTDKLNLLIDENNAELCVKNKELNRVDDKLNKISSAKKSFILDFVTFFIRKYLTSNSRKTKLTNKKDLIEKDITSLVNKIETEKEKITNLQKSTAYIRQEIDKKQAETEEQKKKIYDIYKKNKESVVPLPIDIEEEHFTPLKIFIGLPYKKIIGCYILRNTENNRCYVGQSKDIYKRLHQHFKGTVPNNIIFAEDYYSSRLENKENLFEVSIIQCKTKDELDETERNLIELYEAYTKGYNGTGGNK